VTIVEIRRSGWKRELSLHPKVRRRLIGDVENALKGYSKEGNRSGERIKGVSHRRKRGCFRADLSLSENC
jgi:hypothetical protein